MNQDYIEFNKRRSQRSRDTSVKVCLRGGDKQVGCSGKIVLAHSIQRGKILTFIAGGSSGEVYCLRLGPTEDMMSAAVEFKREGIKRFSTFS